MPMRIFYFGDAELRLLFGSAASVAMRGHEAFHVTCSRGPFRSAINRIQLEVQEGSAVTINQINIPAAGGEGIARSSFSLGLHGFSPSVLTFLKQLSPDVIISYPESWNIADSISKKLRVPLIFCPNNVRALFLFSLLRFFHKYSDIPRAPFSVFHNVYLSQRSDFTIAQDKQVEGFLRRFGIRKVARLRPILARIKFKQGESDVKAHTIELPEPYVLSISTISRERNSEIDLNILQILMAVANEVPDVTFVVVGTSVQDLANVGMLSALPHNMQLVGKIFDDELLNSIYRKARCVLCPMIFPALSQRVQEALFYKKAIIMTKTIADYYGGLVEGKHCIIEENFVNWPARVRRVVTDEHLRRNLEAGAENYYSKEFSPRRHGLLLERIIDYVLSK